MAAHLCQMIDHAVEIDTRRVAAQRATTPALRAFYTVVFVPAEQDAAIAVLSFK